MIRSINHAAFRCLDSAKTIEFYVEGLGLAFSMASQSEIVPSMGITCPHFHMFFELADGSNIAFFEAPLLPLPTDDPGIPPWIQHIALDVADDATLIAAKQRLDALGITTSEIIDHGISHSVYFSDPSGHRLELIHWLDRSAEMRARRKGEAPARFIQWQKRKALLANDVGDGATNIEKPRSAITPEDPALERADMPFGGGCFD